MTLSPAAEPTATRSAAKRDDLPNAGNSYIWLMVLAQFGVYIAFITPLALSLSIRVEQLAPGEAGYLGYITGFGGITAVLSNPLIGMLSDRTRRRLGRRRPYLIACTAIGLFSLLVMAIAPSILVLGLGWCLAQLGWGSVLTLLTTSLADRLPESQRGRVAGIVGVVWQLAPVVGAISAGALAGDNLLLFLLPGAVALLAMIAFVCLVHEPDSRTMAPAEPFTLASLAGTVVFNPRKCPDFAWNWLGRFLVMFGLTLNTTFTAFFLADRTGRQVKDIGGLVAAISMGTLVVTMLGAFGGGVLSDRLHRRKIFVFGGAVVFAAGAVVTGLAPNVAVIVAGSVLVSLGIGIFSSVEQALILDVLPNRDAEAGRYTGIATFTTTIAQGIAPFLAPAILIIGASGNSKNYTLLYLVAAAIAIIGGMVVLTRVKAVR